MADIARLLTETISLLIIPSKWLYSIKLSFILTTMIEKHIFFLSAFSIYDYDPQKNLFVCLSIVIGNEILNVFSFFLCPFLIFFNLCVFQHCPLESISIFCPHSHVYYCSNIYFLFFRFVLCWQWRSVEQSHIFIFCPFLQCIFLAIFIFFFNFQIQTLIFHDSSLRYFYFYTIILRLIVKNQPVSFCHQWQHCSFWDRPPHKKLYYRIL